MLLIKNGMIHDAVKEEAFKGDILVKDGKIAEIGENLSAEGAEVVDAAGLDVYPGFVEAHCHTGLAGKGIGYEGQDYNEMNDAVTPQLHAIDAINPMDPCLMEAARAGVTCFACGPGSTNALGGTFAAIKPVGKRVDNMIVKFPVAMKCAFGENPKTFYKGKFITSRMTNASLIREAFNKAILYKKKLEAANGDIMKMPDYDAKSEALIPVLNREIPLKAHAHQANDILTAIRLAKEFNVDLTIDHVTDGNCIVEELAKENYRVAVGPTLGHATKFELVHKSWTTPGVLANAGLQVSIITDAPFSPLNYLPLYAGMAVKAGMKKSDALRAITINPAKHLGIEDRVGSLEVGKDADIVVFDGDPMTIEGTPVHVFIDGKEI